MSLGLIIIECTQEVFYVLRELRSQSLAKEKCWFPGDCELLRDQFCSFLANTQWKAKAFCWSNKSACSACLAICFFMLGYGIHWANACSLLTLDLEVDGSNYEQLNNMDFPYENGDGFHPCCNTTDAYAKIGMKAILIF